MRFPLRHRPTLRAAFPGRRGRHSPCAGFWLASCTGSRELTDRLLSAHHGRNRAAAPHGPSSARSNLSSAPHHHSTPGGGPTGTPPVRASTPPAGRWHRLPAGPRPRSCTTWQTVRPPATRPAALPALLRDLSTNSRPASRTDPASLANPGSPPHRVTSQISPMSGALSLEPERVRCLLEQGQVVPGHVPRISQYGEKVSEFHKSRWN